MTSEQINSIIVAQDLEREYFVWQMGDMKNMSIDERLEAFFGEQYFNEEEEKVFALMEHTGNNWDEAEADYDSANYKVVTDIEADELLEEALNQYIEDCVLTNIETQWHKYFDEDSWKLDNRDDRGFWLNYHDGSEDEEIINGTIYYIYKQ